MQRYETQQGVSYDARQKKAEHKHKHLFISYHSDRLGH